MGGAGVVLMRITIANMAFDDDQGWHVVGASEGFDRVCDSPDVVGVTDAIHIPAISQEARGDVIAEGEIRVAFDRDAVAVVDPTEVSQHQMSRSEAASLVTPSIISPSPHIA